MSRVVSCIVFCALVFSGLAMADGSIILAEGYSASNAYSGSLPDFFDDWCDDQCIPTVTLEVTDVKKTRTVGRIHAWGKEFVIGPTLVFKEFILYEFQQGNLYTLSQDGGHPGGAFVDPSLIPPKAGDVVLVGGAEGLVVGGTGKYKHASGRYSTRLKVEEQGGVFVYYDELFFRFRDVVVP